MPYYKFVNHDTGEEWEELMGIAACDVYLEQNPNIERLFNGIPMIVGGYNDRAKTDNGFKEVLSKIAQNNPTSELAKQYGAKDAKSAKTRQAVDKFKKKNPT
jgi:hypothetical protein